VRLSNTPTIKFSPIRPLNRFVADSSEVFIGRQPIFDRNQRVVGYEILFRGDDTAEAGVVNGASATATVILNSLTEIGLERLVGEHIAWINLPREAALAGIGRELPPGVTGFEIIEGELVDDELLDAIRALKQRGYRISLDDFEYSPELEPLVLLADVVKLDYMALGAEGFARQVEMLKPYRVSLLAEKVEGQTEHLHCMALGCDLFQGFFYQEPELIREKRIEVGRGSVLQIIAALQNTELQFDQLEPLIARDLPLSVRLLRYINSAFFGLPREVTSIRQALVLLGIDNVRRWATLTVMGSLSGKTSELTSTALIRARFCELAGAAAGLDAAEMFTVGLFSLIDAMMDATLEDVLDELPFPDEMRVALLRHAGPMGAILDAATALEGGYFGDAKLLVAGAGALYVEALLWAQEASGALFDSVGR
jgi:c-di-GMP phosphodiesterase